MIDDSTIDPIEAVAARLEAIGASMAEADGVRRFNELYLAVTREIAGSSGAGAFEDPGFVSRLDVVFADLYLGVIDLSLAGEPVPRAWAPLFEKRADPRIDPVQFAIAGLNTHIGHDLPLALAATGDELGISLQRDTPQHRDYLLVDSLLERVQAEVKDRFTTGLVRKVDEVAGRVDDVLAIWRVAKARDNAWTQAQLLHAIDGQPFLRKQFLLALGRNVGFAGRALLIRTR